MVGDPQGAKRPDLDDLQWKQVTTPYAWNDDAAFRVSIHDLPVRVARYRKTFRMPAESARRKVLIELEGIRQAGEVYPNGQFIGRHEDGVMACGFDISKTLKPALGCGSTPVAQTSSSPIRIHIIDATTITVEAGLWTRCGCPGTPILPKR